MNTAEDVKETKEMPNILWKDSRKAVVLIVYLERDIIPFSISCWYSQINTSLSTNVTLNMVDCSISCMLAPQSDFQGLASEPYVAALNTARVTCLGFRAFLGTIGGCRPVRRSMIVYLPLRSKGRMCSSRFAKTHKFTFSIPKIPKSNIVHYIMCMTAKFSQEAWDT